MREMFNRLWCLVRRGPRSPAAVGICLGLAVNVGAFSIMYLHFELGRPGLLAPVVVNSGDETYEFDADDILINPETGERYAEVHVSPDFEYPSSWECLRQSGTKYLRCRVPLTDEVTTVSESPNASGRTQLIDEGVSRDEVIAWVGLALSALMAAWTIFSQREHVAVLAGWVSQQSKAGAGMCRRLVRTVRSRL